MGLVASYTREQWERIGGWRGIQSYTDGGVLLFREEDEPEDDVLPQVIRLDPATGYQPYPEDIAEPLPPVPFRYYSRDDEGNWIFEQEGADLSAHERIGIGR